MKWFIVALTLVACSKSAPPSETPAEAAAPARPAPASANTSQERPECINEEGEKVECEFDSDCCDGFSCGIDPEGSYRIRVCMWDG